jgi:hypothetical protein
MIRNDATLGRMCRAMIRNLETPMSSAARTKSRSFRESDIDLTILALIIHPRNPRRSAKISQPDPFSRGDTIEMIRNPGKIRSRSMQKRSTRSVQPPRYPAAAPASEASTVENRATTRPMMSDLRSPYVVCEKMSWPILLVPHQCAAEGAERIDR